MKANGSVTTTLLKDDLSATPATVVGQQHDSRRASEAGRVKYRRTRSVGRAEEITKEENKQRREQPDKP